MITDATGRDELSVAHPRRGSAMLQAIELRGTPDEATFDGHTLRLLRLEQLRQTVRQGITAPSSASWAAYTTWAGGDAL